MSKYAKVVAIDGPSGSGKSTIAKKLSEKLNLTYLDTGAMYRAVGYYLDKNNIDEKDIEESLKSIQFEYAPSKKVLIELNGEDLTTKIREHHVSTLASKFSQIGAVRNYLVHIQREIAKIRPSILEGRDIGTVVFPDAALKIFLTADPKERAHRRFLQLKESGKLHELTEKQILEDIISRDKRDACRELAPLKKALDALEVDTTSMSMEDVEDRIEQEFLLKKARFS